MNIKNAPVTQTVFAHGYTGKNVGLGAALYNDITGPSRRSGINFSTAYHIKVKKPVEGWLSFGISALFFQYTIDQSQLTLGQTNDPVITGNSVSRFTPDAAFGVYYYTDKYYLGFSIPNLLQSKLDLFNVSSPYENQIRRTYFFSGSYDYFLKESNFIIEPTFLLRAVVAAPMQLDITTLLRYQFKVDKKKRTIGTNKNFAFGLTYRTSDALVILTEFNIDLFHFGYSYDIILSDISPYSGGTHEITVGLSLVNAISKEKNSKYRNIYRRF